ncbi:unnamed protein product, partial [Prorocentrum cordatum]
VTNGSASLASDEIASPTSTSRISAATVAAWPRASCTGDPSSPACPLGQRRGPRAAKQQDGSRSNCSRCRSRSNHSRRSSSRRKPSHPSQRCPRRERSKGKAMRELSRLSRKDWTSWTASSGSWLGYTRQRLRSWWSSTSLSRPSCVRSCSRKSRPRSGSSLLVSRSPKSSSRSPSSRRPASSSKRSWRACRRRSSRRMPLWPSPASSCWSSRASGPNWLVRCRRFLQRLLAQVLATTRAVGQCPSWSKSCLLLRLLLTCYRTWPRWWTGCDSIGRLRSRSAKLMPSARPPRLSRSTPRRQQPELTLPWRRMKAMPRRKSPSTRPQPRSCASSCASLVLTFLTLQMHQKRNFVLQSSVSVWPSPSG